MSMNPSEFGDKSMLSGDSLARANEIAEAALPESFTTEKPVVREETAIPEPAQEAQVEQPQAEQAPSEGKVFEVPEDTLVRVKIDGEVKEVPYKEFKDSLQREAAWHQRQQKLAEGKRQLEQYYAQQFAQLEQQARQVAAYEQMLRDQAAKMIPQQQPQQTSKQSPDEIATLGEVHQAAERVGQTIEQKIAAHNQQVQQQFQQQLALTAEKLKQEMATKQNALKFDQGLGQVLNNPSYKALEVVPNLEQNLRYEVWKLQPETIEEAVEFAEKIAQNWASKLKTIHIAEQQKADAGRAKAKMEPSDGSPPRPTSGTKPKSFLTKDGKLDHGALRQAAMALLD